MPHALQLWQSAQQCLARGDASGAREQLRALLRVVPAHTHAHLLLGGIAHAEGDLRAATQHAVDAARAPPEDAGMISNIVNALVLVGEMTRARECLALPAIARCRDGAVLVSLASAQQMLGEHPQALAMLERAIAAGLDSPDIRYLRGVQLMFNGRLDEAASAFGDCLRQRSVHGRAAVALARLRKQTREDNHVAFIDAHIERVARGSEDHGAFEFARYKELEDIGELDAAWSALERGNAIMAARLPQDVRGDSALIDALIARCDSAFLAPADEAHDGPQPIFVVGMPRSGTTVLERILGNHSQITSAGELGDFARQLRWSANRVTMLPLDPQIIARAPGLDYSEIGRRYLAQTQWRAEGRRFFVDKLPINYLNAGFVHRALPHARILHMTREAMDVCFSNYRAFFGEGYAYSYRFDSLVAQYTNYRRLMAHWHRMLPGRILDVSYETLVDDPEAAAAAIFEFCGLPFEAGTGDLRRNVAATATLSTMQVREGIHRRGLGEWQRYEEPLSALQQRLRDAGVG
ncbi:MAG: sulfotransferase [Rudaea sp.]